MTMQQQPQIATGHYAAPVGGVFGMALRIGILSLIMFGINRFWGKTRLRRYFWANTRMGPDAIEFIGRPCGVGAVEKLADGGAGAAI
jgi:uncharacterized membrane protein YjgN (DUF898 family)